MANKQYYTYILETDAPVWPRHIADELMASTRFASTLIRVTDLQNDGHIYGDTYSIEGRYVRPARRGDEAT
ncbi:MAG TPA: hypothetical protein VGW38_26630 [Chloroflexota bacterium]|nr:hypothetical protein [Chloroflexota bacterium]